MKKIFTSNGIGEQWKEKDENWLQFAAVQSWQNVKDIEMSGGDKSSRLPAPNRVVIKP